MQATISPVVLRWARQRAQLSTEDAASRLHIKPGRLESWETGDDRPTFLQARSIASVLRVPFGYLFLPEPPQESLPLPDLRTVRDAALRRPSVDFFDVVTDSIRKQEWMRDYRKDEGAEPLAFSGRFSGRTDVTAVAGDMSNVLEVNDGLRADSRNWEEFLRAFMDRADRCGILVMRSGIVGNNTTRPLSVEEFRGFAISDSYAPLVFINGRDSKAAQIFTLAHELAHIWIGVSGVSNVSLQDEAEQAIQPEIVCNAIAAELLVPREDFRASWDRRIEPSRNVFALVRRYRVSSLVVLRRALDLQFISRGQFSNLYAVENERAQAPRGDDAAGGDFYRTLWIRNGSSFTRAVVSSTLEGRTLYRDAARLLGVRVKHIEQIAERLGPR